MFLRRVLCAKPAQAHAGSFRADIIVGPICSQTLYLCAQVIFLLYRSLLRRDFAQEFALNHMRVRAERKITCAPSAMPSLRFERKSPSLRFERNAKFALRAQITKSALRAQCQVCASNAMPSLRSERNAKSALRAQNRCAPSAKCQAAHRAQNRCAPSANAPAHAKKRTQRITCAQMRARAKPALQAQLFLRSKRNCSKRRAQMLQRKVASAAVLR